MMWMMMKRACKMMLLTMVKMAMVETLKNLHQLDAALAIILVWTWTCHRLINRIWTSCRFLSPLLTHVTWTWTCSQLGNAV